MGDFSAIKKLIREIVGANPNLPISGKVLDVSGDSCTVQLKSGLKLTDVKLKATLNDSDNKFLITPKVGSNVLMISLSGELDNLTVIKVDDIAKFEFIQGDLEFVVDSSDNKIVIKNSVCSLLDVFTDLTDLLQQIKVYTPSGPSGTPLPDTIIAIEQLSIKYNELLK